MMKIAKMSALAPFAALFLLTSASAQQAPAAEAVQQPMMGGQPIPADQVQAAQDWCKELQAQQGLTGTQQPEATMSPEQTQAAIGTQTTVAPGNTAAPAAAAPAFDVTKVTLEMCQEAGFTDQEGD